MAMRLAAGEVLVLVTEDNSFGQSNSKIERVLMDLIHAYSGKSRFSMEVFEDFSEKPI